MSGDRFMTGRNPDAFVGCLLGTAVGDALGLPYEGLSARRARRLFPDTRRHHLVVGKGLVSDDTEHACFVAQAVIRSRGDVDVFRRRLARLLRWWMLGLPAGIGFATLRSIIKLWAGISPQTSGVFSAGNGPAMRAAILGVAFGRDRDTLQRFVRASTEITHSDPRAYFAALAVALASLDVVAVDDDWRSGYLEALTSLLPDAEARPFLELVEAARISAEDDEDVSEFAERIGSKGGISGYSYHTVPCVLQVLFRHGNDFESGLQELVRAGGDTDTTGAIYGGIVGARAGKSAIPETWLDGIIEWPRSVSWLERLGVATADALDDPEKCRPPTLFVPAILLRNLFFLAVVLAHGCRRLLPPY